MIKSIVGISLWFLVLVATVLGAWATETFTPTTPPVQTYRVEDVTCLIEDTVANSNRATTLIKSLNTANLSAGQTLNNRIFGLAECAAVLPAGTLGGSPD